MISLLGGCGLTCRPLGQRPRLTFFRIIRILLETAIMHHILLLCIKFHFLLSFLLDLLENGIRAFIFRVGHIEEYLTIDVVVIDVEGVC